MIEFIEIVGFIEKIIYFLRAIGFLIIRNLPSMFNILLQNYFFCCDMAKIQLSGYPLLMP